jgi:hypothetical protein
MSVIPTVLVSKIQLYLRHPLADMITAIQVDTNLIADALAIYEIDDVVESSLFEDITDASEVNLYTLLQEYNKYDKYVLGEISCFSQYISQVKKYVYDECLDSDSE